MKKLFLLCIVLSIGCEALNPNAPTKTAVITSFTADATTILLGLSTVLRWDAQGPKGLTCRIDPTIGNVSTVGYVSITPVITTTYSLSCSIEGQGPAVRFITVVVK